MGHRSTRVGRVEDSAESSDSEDSEAETADEWDDEVLRTRRRYWTGDSVGVDDPPAGTRTNSSDDSEQDHSTNSLVAAERRYGIDLSDRRDLYRLQRMESDFHVLRLQQWFDEGIPFEAIGNPTEMERFRERKGTPVPWNVEQRNRESLQRSTKAAADDSRAGETGVPDSVRDVIASPGQSLDPSIQRAMEDRMGESFGDVRVHTGPQATEACESIDARAFTVGNHVAFNSGEYDPDSPEGQHVIAHELAHVRQQTGGAVSMLPQAGLELEIDPDPRLERKAEETARRVMAGGEIGVQALSGYGVHVQRTVYREGSGPDTDSDAPTGDEAGSTRSALDDIDADIREALTDPQRGELAAVLADHPHGSGLVNDLGPDATQRLLRSGANLDQVFSLHGELQAHQRNRFVSLLRNEDLSQSQRAALAVRLTRLSDPDATIRFFDELDDTADVRHLLLEDIVATNRMVDWHANPSSYRHVDADVTATDFVHIAKNGDVGSTQVIARGSDEFQSSGSVQWLERGDSSRGMEHILNRHATQDQFYRIDGVSSANDIRDLIHVTLRAGTPNRIPPEDGGGTAFVHTVSNQDVTVIVGDNGYIVTARPGDYP